jgi:hypothetical protein
MDAPEQGAELVGIIINNAGEPDAIVKAIAPIYRQAEAAKDECREVLWYMIQAAFNVSAAHRFALDEYLAAIEEGREPSEEAVARFASQRQGVESEAEVIYGSSVLLSGSDGITLFRSDFADDKQESKSIEFHIFDETGAPLHSIVVRAKGFDPEAEGGQ